MGFIKQFQFAWVFALLLVTAPVIGENNSSKETTSNGSSNSALHLKALLEPVHSLRGSFTQVLRDAEGLVLQESEGKFAVQRPGKFLWHTAAPFEQVLLSDEKELFLYDPDLEQMTIRPVDERLQQTPLLILSGETTQLLKHFEVKQLSDDRFELTPKSESGSGAGSAFQTLTMAFKDKTLSQIILLDGLGQQTALDFSQLLVNPVLDAAVFTLEVPPGTDILRDE